MLTDAGMWREARAPRTKFAPRRTFTFRRAAAAISLAASAALIAGCGSSGKGPVALNWYVFPEPSGSFQAAANSCSAASRGQYTINLKLLSTDADQQRVSMVRRLAAKDASLDILALDVDWTAEFATARWIRPWPAALAGEVTKGDLAGPVATATWQNRIWAAPVNSNTQLLWYRKDLVPSPPKTWSAMFKDAVALAKEGKPHYVEEQGAQYEGLTVWFNSLVDSAGGGIISAENKLILGQPGETAAAIMRDLAVGPAADPSLNVNKEDQARTQFESGKAAFEINYPFVWPAAAKAGIQAKMGYGPFPAVVPGAPAKVSIGGYNLAVSAYSKHPQLAFQAISCMVRPQYQVTNAIKGGLAPVSAAIYDQPAFGKAYPFHALIKSQLETYGIRPKTAAYSDVSLAIQKALSPTSNIQPNTVVKSLRHQIKLALSSEALL